VKVGVAVGGRGVLVGVTVVVMDLRVGLLVGVTGVGVLVGFSIGVSVGNIATAVGVGCTKISPSDHIRIPPITKNTKSNIAI
jgi:hypothetical protein